MLHCVGNRRFVLFRFPPYAVFDPNGLLPEFLTMQPSLPPILSFYPALLPPTPHSETVNGERWLNLLEQVAETAPSLQRWSRFYILLQLSQSACPFDWADAFKLKL